MKIIDNFKGSNEIRKSIVVKMSDVMEDESDKQDNSGIVTNDTIDQIISVANSSQKGLTIF